jgi:DNA uptake protein ComE-like DNA-binding protein
MKVLLVSSVALALAVLAGCSASPSNQEQVRQNAAATTAIVRDQAKVAAQNVKAAALGVRDGLKHDKDAAPVDINTANRLTLTALPGMTPALASRVIRNRPYTDSAQLLQRKILPPDVFAKVSPRITTSH